MDVDMDDLGMNPRDPVREFLQHKLIEIEKKCENFKGKIKEKETIYETKLVEYNCHSSIRISLSGKRICNKKFVFYFLAENDSDKCVENLKILLTSANFPRLKFAYRICEELDDQSTCDYKKCNKFTHNLIFTENIIKKAHIVVSFEVGNFYKCLKDEIKGYIFGDQDKKTININLPDMEISVDDYSCGLSTDWSFHPEDFLDVLTVMCSNFTEELLLIVPDGWCDDLNRNLEIYCNFVPSNAKTACKNYFFMGKNYDILSGCLVEIHNDPQHPQLILATLYTKLPESVYFFSHLVQKSIPGTKVLPKMCFDTFLMSHKLDVGSKEKLEVIMEKLNTEIDFVEKKVREVNSSDGNPPEISEDRMKFFKKLTVLENETNLVFNELLQY